MAHNYYQKRGGEDVSFESEIKLLRNHGEDVVQYTKSNYEIQEPGLRNSIRLASNTVWSESIYREISKLIEGEKPDIVHFQNTFPLMSPAVYKACKEQNVPVVQTLRNYRLMCPNGLFFRDGHVCEDCLMSSIPLAGMIHRCYKESFAATSVVTLMLAFHNLRKTWSREVDLFITLTEFSRQKFLQAGFPAEKIVVKPNFLYDPGLGNQPGEYAVYVGRLSSEKGIITLLSAWDLLVGIPLVIIGEGPLRENVLERAHSDREITLIDQLPHEKVIEIVKNSKFLIFPSEWYETFGRVIIEANACGKPCIASRIGVIQDLVKDGTTGFLFTPGDAQDLADKVRDLWNCPSKLSEMAENARKEYEGKYTPEKNYDELLKIYQLVLGNKHIIAE